MIYTCYEMIRDCRADKPEGWRHLVSAYVPVIRKLLAHYTPAGAAAGSVPGVERILTELRRPESSLFQSMDGSPERWFVAELRQAVLAQIPSPEPAIEIPLEVVAAALAPLTLTQKVAAWTETMTYDATAGATMLRMAPATVGKIREQAAGLLRGQIDTWSRTALAENGRLLGAAAAAASTKDCIGPKLFLDVLDGRATWQGREEMERHATGCWHCVDHFGRMAEVIELLRGVKLLEETEAAPFYEAVGMKVKKAGFFRRG